MAAAAPKKQDDKFLQVLRELVTYGGGNRQCFDCGQKGPTYVNMTIGTFVCTRCSGVLRGLTPPHRVKSISMATFTQDDVDYLKSHGNDECAKTWLGLWDPKRAGHQDQRELMIDKYERKRYYLEPASPLKSLTNSVTLKTGLMAGVGAEVPTTSRAVAAVAAGAASKIASNDSSSYKNNIDDHIDLVKAGNGSGKNEQSTRNQYRQQNTNAERSFQLTPPSTQRTTMNGLHKVVTGETGSTGGSATTVTAISRPQQQHQQNDYNHLQNAFMQLCNNNKNNNVSNSNRNELNVLHMTTSRMSEGSSATSMNGFGVDTDFVADFGSANIFDATTSNSSKMSSPPKMNIGGSTITSNGYAKIKPLKKQQQKQKHQLLKGPGQTNGNMSQSNSIGNGTSANFADFDHAPIFNAGGHSIPNYQSRSIYAQQTNSETNNNNTALNSTPSADRYAALKDLDEQLRESKAAAKVVTAYRMEMFGKNGIHSVANSFKNEQANPFHGTSPTKAQNYFSQMAVISKGNDITSQQPTTNTHCHSISNNNAIATTCTAADMFHLTVVASGPSGCGFRLGAPQPTAITATATGGEGKFENPFTATSTLNSNNPFL